MGVILCLTNDSVLQAVAIFQHFSKKFKVIKNIYVQDMGVILCLTNDSVLQAVAICQHFSKIFSYKKHLCPGRGCYLVFN